MSAEHIAADIAAAASDPTRLAGKPTRCDRFPCRAVIAPGT